MTGAPSHSPGPDDKNKADVLMPDG